MTEQNQFILRSSDPWIPPNQRLLAAIAECVRRMPDDTSVTIGGFCLTKTELYGIMRQAEDHPFVVLEVEQAQDELREAEGDARGSAAKAREASATAQSATQQLAQAKIEALHANSEANALREFKEYVHKRLDEAGIPSNPGGPHTDAGCRVGDRLDLLVKERDKTQTLLTDARRWLNEAGTQFAKYAGQHAAKKTADGDTKAATNRVWASNCFTVAEATRND